MLEKLLGIATIGGTLTNVTLLHRFLTRIALIVVLAVISGCMVGLLMIGVFYSMYCALIYYGLAPNAAIVAVASFVFVLASVLICMTFMKLRQLRDIFHDTSSHNYAHSPHIGGIIEAFLTGLLTQSPRTPQN